MSCQQVPRLPEDPYTFTEPPVTAKYFSSQSHRVHPYSKSFARPYSVTPAAPASSHSPAPPSYRQPPQTTHQPSSHPPPTAPALRPDNGHTPLGGLPPKRNGPIYGKTVNRQQPPTPALPQRHHHQQQPHNSPLQAVSPPPTIDCTPAAQQPTLCQPASTVTSAHGSATFNHPPSITPATAAASILVPPSEPTTTHLPHSTFDSGRKPYLASQQRLSGFDYRKNQHFSGTGELEPLDSKNGTRKSFGHKAARNTLAKSIPPPTPLYRKSSISSTCSSSASSSPPSSSFMCPSHLDSLPMAATGALFSRPIKVEVKLESPVIAPSMACLESAAEYRPPGSSVVARSKRSYSESSHHEALQRIPTKRIKVEESDAVDAKPDATKLAAAQPPNVVVAFIAAQKPPIDSVDALPVQKCWFTNEARFTSRDQRLDHKLALLTRQLHQHSAAQQFRSNAMARKRLHVIAKSLRKDDEHVDKQTPALTCDAVECAADALPGAAFCYAHITKTDKQQLFHACTAKFADNSQCRLPVFDVSHELALCREHAWKRDNYTRKFHEQKPKKAAAAAAAAAALRIKRAKPANASNARPAKRSRKKKPAVVVSQPQPRLSPNTRLYQAPDRSPVSTQHFALSSNDSFVSSDVSQMFAPSPQHQMQSIAMAPTHQHHAFMQTLNHHHHNISHLDQQPQQPLQSLDNCHHYFMPQQQPTATITADPSRCFFAQMSGGLQSDGSSQHASQDLYTLCENSSAYESSEDTGIGGLSESEQLMGVHDDMLEEHELTSVLNQLPPNAFDELFTAQQNVFKSTQDEEEYLDRALEDVESLQQMAGSDHFLDGFLDVDDEILEDVDMSCVVDTASLGGGLAASISPGGGSLGSLIDIRGLVHT